MLLSFVMAVFLSYRVPPQSEARAICYHTKNPNGYCPDHSTGVACPIGLGVSAGSTRMEQV